MFLRRVVLGVLVVLLAGCSSGNSPTAPKREDIVDQLSVVVESDNFIFRMSPGDSVDVERQEAFHRWAVDQLALSTPKMEYFKYRDVGQMAALTGESANGWADPDAFAVHSIFPWHNHETVHVYSALIGRPSDFFNEGLAVAMSVDPLGGSFRPSYSGAMSVHDWARGEGDNLLRIADVVTTSDFRAVSEFVGYQTAGSFVAFLLQEYGNGSVISFFSSGQRDDSRGRIESSFQAAFGVTLAEAEESWRLFLGTPLPGDP